MADVTDFELDILSNVEMEPSLASFDVDFFTLTGIEYTSEPFLADEMWLNAMEPTSARAGVQDIDMEPDVEAADPEIIELPPISSIRQAGRGNWASKGDWEKVRPLIKGLYVDEDKTLKEVMAIIEKKHGFKATPKMYKDRIKKWQLDKNNKEHEMAAILRKKRQRDSIGKSSVFKVRGRVVDFAEVDHYFRRKGIRLDQVSAGHADPSTPPAISCATPPCSPTFKSFVPRSISTPHSITIPEQLLFNIDQYMSVSFENKTWIANEEGILIKTLSGGHPDNLREFYRYCTMSLSLFRRNSYVDGRRVLSTACSHVQTILKAQVPDTTIVLLNNFLRLILADFPDIVNCLVNYVSRMARILFNAEHPWAMIWSLMGRIDPDRLKDVMVMCWKCVNNGFMQHLGPYNKTLLASEVDLSRYNNGIDDLVRVEKRLRQLQSVEIPWMRSRRLSLNLLGVLWQTLAGQKKFAEAESTACELIKDAREAMYYIAQVMGFEYLAIAQHRQDKLNLAQKNIREALDIIRRHWKDSDSWALNQLLFMQRTLRLWEHAQTTADLSLNIEYRISLETVYDDFE